MPIKGKLLSFLLLPILSIQISFGYFSMTPKLSIESNSVYNPQKSLKTIDVISSSPAEYLGTITKYSTIKFQNKYGLSPVGIAQAHSLSKISKPLVGITSVSANRINSKVTVKVSAVNKQFIPQIPQTPYKNGVGAYEGVVLHYTDNIGDSAQKEADFAKKNWNIAFVHEFVDPKQIIQIADPRYTCWGAGPYANQRFVQIELCHARTKADFNKSYNMFCKRAAEYLYARKLGVTPARPNGTGTLWAHVDVTNYLGGTDHKDPIAYLSKWGKTWQDVINTVKDAYNKLAAEDKSKN